MKRKCLYQIQKASSVWTYNYLLQWSFWEYTWHKWRKNKTECLQCSFLQKILRKNYLFQLSSRISQDNLLSLIRMALMHLTLDNNSNLSVPIYRCFLKNSPDLALCSVKWQNSLHILLLELYSVQLPFTLHSARLAMVGFWFQQAGYWCLHSSHWWHDVRRLRHPF